MPSFQITERIKQDVRNARVIGEFTVKTGVQKIPGVMWGLLSRMRDSLFTESVLRIRPDEHVSGSQESGVSDQSEIRVAEPCDGYDLLTGNQIVELLQTVSESQVRDIHDYECTHRNRALVITAALSRIPAR